MELTEISKNRDRDYFHCIRKCIYVPWKLLKIQGYKNIFQSSLQTELSSRITVHYSVNYNVWQCNALEYNVAITNLSKAIFPTLKKLFLSCFTFDKESEFLFLVLGACQRLLFMCMSLLVSVSFVFNSKSVITDSIEELLSRQAIISSSCLEGTCDKKEMEC